MEVDDRPKEGKKGHKGHFRSLNEVGPPGNEDFKFSDYLASLFGEGDEVYDKSGDPFPDSDFSMPSRSDLQQIDRLASEMPDDLPLTRRNLLSQDELSFGTGPSFDQPAPIYTYLKKETHHWWKNTWAASKGKSGSPTQKIGLHPIFWVAGFPNFPPFNTIHGPSIPSRTSKRKLIFPQSIWKSLASFACVTRTPVSEIRTSNICVL